MGRQDATHNKVESGKVKLRQQPGRPIRLGRLIGHPVTLMATALTLSLSVASVATFEMLKVDPLPQSAVLSSSDDQFSTRLRSDSLARTDRKDSLPIVSLGAVAISCAAGSFLLCRCFWTRKPDRRMPLSSSSRQTSPSSVRTDAGATPRITVSQDESPHSQTAVASVAATIVPSNEAHPLDWSEPSIADNLDLRRKRPLSHWL